MEKNEIIEGNKLIAKFMGYPYIEQDCYLANGSIGDEQVEYNKIGTVISDKPISFYQSGTYKCLRLGNKVMTLDCDIDTWYNSSWDWLVPVMIQCLYKTVPMNHKLQKDMQYVLGGLVIIASWLEVVKYIQWYNGVNKRG